MFVGLMALVMLRSPIAARQATFTAKTEAVRVDVLVTENGRPVLGLKPADFVVVDNGVPQQVDLASFEQIPLNVVLTLDTSNSVAGERLEHLRSACKALLDKVKKDEQAAVITFSHVVRLGSGLTHELTPVRTAIEAVQPSGGTALVDASFAGVLLGESDVGRSLMIVFSDGVDTASWLTPDSVLDVARRSDVIAYGVSAGQTRSDFLPEVVEATGGRLFRVEATDDLGPTFVGILEEFRLRYLVSYTPRGVSKEGWHKLDVRVKRRGVTVRARPGYLAGS
jgi:VWFA-related protein